MTAPTMEQMLDYLGMCERATHITGMEESCFVSRREELTRARNAVVARFAELERERDAFRADAERYEVVRCMVPRQFQDAWTLNIRTGKPFDEIIDDLRPFAAIAQRAGETG